MKNTNKKPAITYFVIKRLFDIVFSFAGLAILLVPLFFLSLIVWASSKGPAIFLDERIGKGGVKIHVYKFRTMVADAETNIDKYLTPEQKQIWIEERKLENDPRITRIGKILRVTSIDELPQLLNVFIGNMSFVGPRPITEREINDHFTDEQKKMLYSCKPGLTGFWQVYARNNVDFASGKRQELELKYLEHRTIWTDLKLLILTVPAVLTHKGVK